MSDPQQPDQVWWTTKQIAAARLPDLPATQRGVEMNVQRFNWRAAHGKARRRSGRGGGWEYHWSLFPIRAQQALLARVTETTKAEARPRDEVWAWFDGLGDGPRAKAEARLLVIQKVEALEAGGVSRDLAVTQIASIEGVSARTIWNWLGLIEGVRIDDRLPYLAPRHQAAQRKVRRAECSDEFWDWLKSDFLRPERPSFASCYRRALRVAREQGWTVAQERTLRNRLNAEVTQLTQVLCRNGVDALKALYPAQTRDRISLHAMEAVNADYHRFDVFVRWPVESGSNSGEGDIVRPQLVAFQDLHSGRILSWRLDRTPNKVGVSLALGDMIERFGIPGHIVLDNGREFANKFLTGGVKTRFRFKVRDDDIPGVLTTLGVKVHWATPYSGQSKPIERAFKDLADEIAKDPRFAGAYTGNRPDAKPENYGNAAVPLVRFIEVVAELIEEHNARPGRCGQTTMGRSILETFESSYAEAPIRKATPEQQRLWLMGAEGLNADRRNGLIRFMGNEYHSEWMYEIAGQKVVARFDPADLRGGLHIYALDGRYLGDAACKLAAGFFDIDEARQHAAARRKWMRAEKDAAAAHRQFTAKELGAYLDQTETRQPAPAPETKIVQITPQVRAPKSAPKPKPMSAAEQAKRAEFVANFGDHKDKRDNAKAPREDAATRFAWAEEIEARLEAGEEVHRDLIRKLDGYRQTPEYRVFKREKEQQAKDGRG